MTQVASAYQAQLKRWLEALFEIDLKIKQFRQQRNMQHIAFLKAAKIELQKRIVQKEIQVELQKAPKQHGGGGGGWEVQPSWGMYSIGKA